MNQLEVSSEGAAAPRQSRPQEDPSLVENATQKKTSVRKRTKTGCLTCRKRRIKCDEAKPTCNNCQKSKRQCEGYSQRLTFKEPLGAPFHHGPVFGHPVYNHQQAQDAILAAHLHEQQFKAASQGTLPTIAPKPPSGDYPLPYGPMYQTPLPPPLAGPVELVPVLYSPEGPVSSGPFLSPTSPQMPHPPSFHQQEFVHAMPPPPPPPPPAHVHPPIQNGNRTVEPIPYVPEHHRSSLPVSGPILDSTQLVSPPAEDSAPLARVKSEEEEEYWNSDDEASMADSEDSEVYMERQAAHLASNDLGILVARHLNNSSVHRYSTSLRDYNGMMDDMGWLQTYTPSSLNSPLNDKETAAVFWYFVNVTGPSISLYERNPYDPAPMFQGQPVPKIEQHIWTYTFPVISFNHPALLQAILALGSLQMAKLQGLPATAAMKHYHLCIRRVAKNYQSYTRRTQPATLAATLLLGFYEVWNSDHEKWCKHMWGARAILREIPLWEMTRGMLELKRNRRQRLQQGLQNHHFQQPFDPMVSDPANLVQNRDMDEVDLDLLVRITGRPVHFLKADPRRDNVSKYTEHDIENFEHLNDLYWWYCKMDVYQSILGGTKLFMEYDLWTQCVPRAPFGRIDAIYGTYDHMMLLLGRVANFVAQDLDRKRRVLKAESSARPAGGPSSNSSPPSFPGLLPSKGQFTRPAGFSPPRDSPSADAVPEEYEDLEAATAAALAEWEAIKRAVHTFGEELAALFPPLGPGHAIPEDTPFGPSKTYRTYGIAGIWMNYYMGLIVLHRAHPKMPPVATVAAGMAARTTAPWACIIGQIAAGLHEDCTHVRAVSTTVGSAFIESSFCLFVAAVQFQDRDQRHWTVKRLHDIARLTGWQSARQIAEGCESAWTKAASVGRGPPYERAHDMAHAFPTSVWANPRRIDRRIRELENQEDRLVLARTERAHYALGLLGIEQDLEKLDLREGV